MLDRLKTYLLGVSLLVILVGGLYLWYWPSPTQTIVRLPVRPYRAPVSELFEKVSKDITLLKVPEYKPTPEQRVKIEKKLGGPIPEGRLLEAVDVGKLPYGGTAVVTAPPSPTQEKGSEGLDVTIYPKKAPFFEFQPERTASLFYGLTWDSKEGKLTNAFLLEVKQDLFRTGPVIWGAKAGSLFLPSKPISYVMVGGSVKF